MPGAFRSMEQLQAALEEIRLAPRDGGALVMIVRRPDVEEREVVESGRLDLEQGLEGDCWRKQAGPKRDGAPLCTDNQLTLMNVRATAAIAPDRGDWPWAGDQLYVDLDLSGENLPPGSRLAIGEALVEITAEPHTGCGKFRRRFGADALAFVNSPVGRGLNLRGVNARVVRAGPIRVGDRVEKVAQEG